MRKKIILPLLAVLLTAALPAQVTTLLNETFDPATFSPYGGGDTHLNPNTGTIAWYALRTTQPNFYVTDDGALFSGGGFGVDAGFESFTLNKGDSISLTVKAKGMEDAATATNYAFRFGLGNHSVTANTTAFPTNGSAIMAHIGYSDRTETRDKSRYMMVKEGDQISAGTVKGSEWWGSTLTPDYSTITLTIKRNNSDGLDVTISINGVPVDGATQSIAAADVPDGNYTFSNLAILATNANNMWIDEVKVEGLRYIPEPKASAAIILCACLVAPFAMRRRQRSGK